MAGSGSSSSSNPSPAPKILLAKPGLVTSSKFNRAGGSGGPDDDSTVLRSRVPSIGSLNLLSDSWDFQIDRFLPFLTDNTEFTVVGVIGPPGVGKSTILNEIYGFDSTSPGMLPPFGIESEETKAMARHFTVGIEPRISAERIILLDTQPLFSPSVLAEMIRPDGSSTVSVISGESLSAELAHEMMSIQKALIKTLENGDEYIAAPIFVHTRLRDRDIAPHNFLQMKKALGQCFSSSSFIRSEGQDASKDARSSAVALEDPNDLETNLKLFLVPAKGKDGSSRPQYESYVSALWKLRDQVLSMSAPSFSRTISERDWLKNSAKIWEIIKNSPIIADYCRTLQSSGLYRK
ncbi:UNVERIFIED_CONTAM: hypothetical protein Scaly_2464000 [Sesamum calycinum]|uniref:Uncharacterized protein n=1 Tax=Sesamum calycinum TaxID=2727403 RepID=A0AAW2LR94_9LAMI